MANPNLDILNTAYADLQGTEFLTFKQSNRLTRELEAARKIMSEDGGTYIERIITVRSPTTGVAVVNGDESAPQQSRQITKKVQTEATFFGAHIPLSKAHLARAKNKKAAYPLIERTSGAFLNASNQDFDSRLLVGVGSGRNAFPEADLQALTSFFGPAAGRTDVVGVEDGLLEHAVKESQTNKFHNLTRSVDDGIYTQYMNVSAFAYATYADFMRQCAEYAPDEDNPELLAMFSPGVYRKYEQEKYNKIQIKMVGDDVNSGVHTSDMIGPAKVVVSERMRESKSALAGTAAADGLVQVICLPTVEMVFYMEPTLGSFEDRGGTQFAVRSEYTAMWNVICMQPPANGAITGGA